MCASPTVSVIIPTFQRARLVGNAIHSALSQSMTDFEVIVVDDGSTDDTASVLAQFGDRIRAIHQPNKGLGAARNTGIKSSKGRLIAFLDDDDEWMPHRLEIQVAVMNADERIALAFADMDLINEAGEVTGIWSDSYSPPPILSIETLFFQNYIPVPTVTVRRCVLDQIGLFDEDLPSCEDYDLWLRIIAGHRAQNSIERLARYRSWQSNMSHDRLRMLTGWVRAKELALQRNPCLQRLPPHILQKYAFKPFDMLAQHLLDAGHVEQADAVRLREQRTWNICAERQNSETSQMDTTGTPP